jgi:hypothetical protein
MVDPLRLRALLDDLAAFREELARRAVSEPDQGP